MSDLWNLPTAEGITPLLRDLLGRNVTAVPAKGPQPPGLLIVGTYIRDDDALSGVCTVDLSLAAHAGAALMMAPVAVAEESVRAKKLDEMLLECLREVLNIGSRWFMPPNAPHVRLHEVFTGDELPKRPAALLKLAPKIVAVEIAIAGYKGGRLGLFSR